VHKTPDVPPGPVNSYRTVDAPWANAQNTPFRKYKRWDHEGGISTPLVAYWPGVIKPGSITHEVGHLIDIMATCLDIAEAPYPEEHHGEDIVPLEGKSLLPVLEGGTRQGHDTLCWEFGECRAVRQDKWKLVQVKGRPWELYDIEVDRTEMHNLAAEEAKRVEAMAAAWDAWAERCNVTY
jgi:arylsulfatase